MIHNQNITSELFCAAHSGNFRNRRSIRRQHSNRIPNKIKKVYIDSYCLFEGMCRIHSGESSVRKILVSGFFVSLKEGKATLLWKMIILPSPLHSVSDVKSQQIKSAFYANSAS